MATAKKPAQKVYRLELTEKQLTVIKVALEEYFRISLNQWRDLADRLAWEDVVLPKNDDPKRPEMFQKVLDTRDAIYEVFMAAGRILWPQGLLHNKGEFCLVAEDLWGVIKHQQWIDRGCEPEWSVDGHKPLHLSDEPLPKIEKIGG